MSDALVPLNEMGIVPSKYADDKVFAGMSSGGFLARLQLFGANSDAAKEGKIQMGNYGLVSGKDIEDLGKEVHALILSWRPKALQIDQAENTVISIFDHTDPKFKDIQNKSEEPNSGCMWGPEFLVYVPEANKYATFFMSSKTMRRVAADLKTLLGKAATIRAQLISNKRFKWHGPVIANCSMTLSIPPKEEMVQIINAFNNPPKSEVEEAPAEDERPR